MTVKELRRECADKRAEYQQARQVHSAVSRLAAHDLTALEVELRDALLAFYIAHGALHAKLRERNPQPKRRLH